MSRSIPTWKIKLIGLGRELEMTRPGFWGTDGRYVKTMGYSTAKSRPRRKARHVLGGVWALERRKDEYPRVKLRISWEQTMAITIDLSELLDSSGAFSGRKEFYIPMPR